MLCSHMPRIAARCISLQPVHSLSHLHSSNSLNRQRLLWGCKDWGVERARAVARTLETPARGILNCTHTRPMHSIAHDNNLSAHRNNRHHGPLCGPTLSPVRHGHSAHSRGHGGGLRCRDPLKPDVHKPMGTGGGPRGRVAQRACASSRRFYDTSGAPCEVYPPCRQVNNDPITLPEL